MSHLNEYLKKTDKTADGISESFKRTALRLVDGHFNFRNGKGTVTGLLCGHVQSGKTGHIFASIAYAADKGFPVFVYLTVDNVYLHEQTYKRASAQLSTMCVCSETEDVLLAKNAGEKPVIVVLKKNYRVLKTWCQHLASHIKNRNYPLIIIDDEGDAASLNTKINASQQSTINTYLNRLKGLFKKCIYIQVTATPQALILQTIGSGWRPEFVYCFEPGKSYIGGDYLYGPESTSICLIPENEGGDLIKGKICPTGLADAILSFLIVGSDRIISGKDVCSMLVHPSVRISAHEAAKDKINIFLRNIHKDVTGGSLVIRTFMQNKWNEIYRYYPKLTKFNDIYKYIPEFISDINLIILNSNTGEDVTYDKKLNIIVGGNSLGRGLTFKGLHIVYYTRTAKNPQADTCWQHSRLFGYDRVPGLCRVYLPPSLMHLFRELNEGNNTLFSLLAKELPEKISLLYPAGIKPTRKNVVDNDELNLIIGGTNYFPFYPKESNVEEISNIIGNKDIEKFISIEDAVKILKLTNSYDYGTWNKDLFCSCLKSIQEYSRGTYKNCKLIVRVNRDVGRGTGTLLSPDDRNLCSSIKDNAVLVMYKLTGNIDKGWHGEPLWVPNVKFPEGYCFYKT